MVDDIEQTAVPAKPYGDLVSGEEEGDHGPGLVGVARKVESHMEIPKKFTPAQVRSRVGVGVSPWVKKTARSATSKSLGPSLLKDLIFWRRLVEIL